MKPFDLLMYVGVGSENISHRNVADAELLDVQLDPKVVIALCNNNGDCILQQQVYIVIRKDGFATHVLEKQVGL